MNRRNRAARGPARARPAIGSSAMLSAPSVAGAPPAPPAGPGADGRVRPCAEGEGLTVDAHDTRMVMRGNRHSTRPRARRSAGERSSTIEAPNTSSSAREVVDAERQAPAGLADGEPVGRGPWGGRARRAALGHPWVPAPGST